MIKIVSSFVLLVCCIASLDAAKDNVNWFYSPYSKKIQPLTKSKPLQASAPLKAPEMPNFSSVFNGQPSLSSGVQMPKNQPSQIFQQNSLQNLLPRVQNTVKSQQAPVLPSSQSAQNDLPSNICLNRNPNDKLPHPSNPNQFVVCHDNSDAIIMDCPNKLVFNLNTLNCENSFKAPQGCASNPCKNNGKCADLPFFQFRCDCPVGFSGDFCETSDSCGSASCGNNGVCMQLALGSPINHFCICGNGLSYGIDCVKNVEANPCLSNDADMHFFASKSNPAVFVHCEGHIPHLKFCAYPLIYSHSTQNCDWSSI